MGEPAETYQETAVGVQSEVRFEVQLEEGEVRIVFHYFNFTTQKISQD
jgi:hypothetical protein